MEGEKRRVFHACSTPQGYESPHFVVCLLSNTLPELPKCLSVHVASSQPDRWPRDRCWSGQQNRCMNSLPNFGIRPGLSRCATTRSTVTASPAGSPPTAGSGERMRGAASTAASPGWTRVSTAVRGAGPGLGSLPPWGGSPVPRQVSTGRKRWGRCR